MKVSETVERSSLENWIHEHKLPQTPRWRLRDDFIVFLFGERIHVNGNGAASLWLHEDSSQRYLATATDEDIKQLVETLRVGSADEQMQAVQQAMTLVSD